MQFKITLDYREYNTLVLLLKNSVDKNESNILAFKKEKIYNSIFEKFGLSKPFNS